jgi:osmoprotectant transport system permease protein
MLNSGVLAAGDPWVRWDWVRDHTHIILADLREHAELTVIAVVLGLVISFPLALLARRFRRTEAPILFVGGVLYTIPSLALFAFLVPWTGLSRTTAEIGLVSYTILILVRNIVTGLDGVPEDALDAARGMGYTGWRQLIGVELPLAAPAIIAGVRIATVTTIGLVTVTVVMGQGGLAKLMLDGFTRDFRTPLVVGLGLTVLLAVTADLFLQLVERLVTPWARAGRT